MSAPVTITLGPKLDLSTAASLFSEISKEKSEHISLDFKDVKNLGSLCLQVLLVTARDARAEGREFSIINTSDRVVDQMRVMGMTPETIVKGSQ